MAVSVIIPTFNRANALKRTFDYLSRSISLPYEVIVVDQVWRH